MVNSTGTSRKRTTLPDIPFPLALFAGGQLKGCNTSFHDEFLGDGGNPRMSLAKFLGREGMRRLREQGWTDAVPTAGPVWKIVVSLTGRERREYDVEARWVDTALQLVLLDRTEKNNRATELRSSVAWSEATFQENPVALALVDGTTITQANNAFARLLGFAHSLEAAGRSFEKHVSSKSRAALGALQQRLLSRTVENDGLEAGLLRSDRTAFPASVAGCVVEHEGRDCILISLRDLTADREREEETRKRVEGWKQTDDILRTVGYPRSLEEIGNRIVEHTLRGLGYEFGMLYLPEPGSPTMRAHAHLRVPGSVMTALMELQTGEGLLGFMLKTREPLAVTMEEYPPHLPHRSVFESVGARTIAILPLVGSGSVHGVLLLGSIRMHVHSDPIVLHRLSGDLGERLASTGTYDLLRQHASRIEQIMAVLPEIIYSLNPSGEFLFISDGVRGIAGYTPEDFYRSSDLWRTILHPDDRTLYGSRISGHRNGEQELRLDYRILPKGKATYRHLRDTIRYIRDVNGTVTGIIGSVREMDEERSAVQDNPG